MADLPIDDTIDVNITNDAGTKKVTVTTDGAKERLDVNATFSENPFPGLSFSSFLENVGSSDMRVDGSGTPVTFTTAPPTGKIWYIHTIDVIIEDTGMNFTKFGGLTALTNGVDFKVKQNGLSEAALATVNRNGDFYIFANDAFIESSTTDILVAHIRVQINTGTTMKLIDSNSDSFSVVVNDNLTSLDVFQVLLRGYEVDE